MSVGRAVTTMAAITAVLLMGFLAALVPDAGESSPCPNGYIQRSLVVLAGGVETTILACVPD